jgi:glycerol-3-phosphate dehydrogenase
MQLRDANIGKLRETTFDVLVIGGGINGAVSAAALSGKGVKVALIDRGDWAGFTSQESSNLAWGGIKYMETYDFALVRKLCMSRNHLIRSFPSIVNEIRFFTSVPKGFRHSRWKLWAGTWLYWIIGNGFTKTPRLLSKQQIAREEPIIDAETSTGGFEYSDAYLHDNDSRFVFGFVRSALNNGCIAANYLESLGSRRTEEGLWVTKARNVIDGGEFDIRSAVLINACGPFADEHNKLSNQKTEHHHALSKGIHLIVEKLTPHRKVLTFFASDGRLFFAIPMGARTCVGTTDTRVDSPYTHVTDEDRDFVLSNINKHLKLAKPLTRDDIIAERCGVRPLAVKQAGDDNRDFLQLSRKHAVDVNHAQRHISIFGGKHTDCVNVGDEISDCVGHMGIPIPFPEHKWYGEPPEEMRREFEHRARLMDLDSYTDPTSSEKLTSRYWRRYGLEAFDLLEKIREDPRQAEVLIKATEYTRCELYSKVHREMIVKLEDFLRRRSKISLVVRKEDIRSSPGLVEACEILFGDQAQQKINDYFAEEGADEGKAGKEAGGHNGGSLAQAS